MSLLQQDTRRPVDDAALGESFTRGTSHIVWAAVIATVLVSIAVTAYVISGEKPAAATGEVLEIWTHPAHSESSGVDAAGVPVPKESYDQFLVFTRVRLRNQSKQPLFLHQIMTNATMPDGTVDSSYAASLMQYERIFQAYPSLAAWHTQGLSPEMTLQPGQTAEGTFVSAFHITEQQWNTRTALDYSFGFQYQPVLKVSPQVQVIKR